MITIFTTPRPFTGEFYNIQLNAIKSWMSLGSGLQIILVNDEEGTTQKVADELNLTIINDYNSNENGTPILDDIFNRVKALSIYEILAHVNTDIILFPDFIKSIDYLYKNINHNNFLIMGRRWDMNVESSLDFDDISSFLNLRESIKKRGKLHGPSGLDYWVFPKKSSIKVPPFCVGRPGMDPWLIYEAKRQRIPVIDATEIITALHQNHGYPKKKLSYFEVECLHNVLMAGGRSNMVTLREADFIVTANNIIQKPNFARRTLGFLSKFYIWRRVLGIKRNIQSYISKLSR